MNIFVGNLTRTPTEDELTQLFAPFDTVYQAASPPTATRGVRGFGFVEMPHDAEAQAAIDELNGATIGGRQLTVNEARPREDRGGPRRPREEGNGSRRPRW